MEFNQRKLEQSLKKLAKSIKNVEDIVERLDKMEEGQTNTSHRFIDVEESTVKQK